MSDLPGLEIILDMLGTIATAPGRARFPTGPRVPRPVWWRAAAVTAVLAVPLPFFAGSILLARGASRMAQDDFLWILGLIGFVVAGFVLVFAVSVLVALAQVVVRIVTERASARVLVGATGGLGIAFGVPLHFAPGVPIAAPLWLELWGAFGIVLAILAPEVREHERSVVEARGPHDLLP